MTAMNPTRPLVLLATGLLFACGGTHTSSAATTAEETAEREAPEHMLDAPTDAYGSLLMHGGQPMLFVAFERGFGLATGGGIQPPAGCADAPSDPASCPATFEGTPALEERFSDHPATVQVIGAEGPCEAQVGELVVLNTSGCETSITIARQLTGCEGPLAPVLRVAGLFDNALHYAPAPEVEAGQVASADAVASLPAEALRTQVQHWVAEPAIANGVIAGGAAVEVTADAGAELLVTLAATFLVSPAGATEECDASLEGRSSTFVRRAGQDRHIELAEWDGLLSWHGQVVAVFTGGPHFTAMHALSNDYQLRELWTQRVWMDNEECGPFGWAYVEHPCGP